MSSVEKMKTRPKKWLVVCAVAIMVCWFLPLYTISSTASGGGNIIETTLGCQLKTGFIRMRDGSMVFSPGLLIPITSALCILAVTMSKRITWFTIGTAVAAGLLAVMQGGYVLITFYSPSFGLIYLSPREWQCFFLLSDSFEICAEEAMRSRRCRGLYIYANATT